MTTVRLIATLTAAAFLAFTAGCGGAEAPGGASDVLPGDLAVYLAVDTDFEGDQWEALDELAAKFPGGENAVQRLLDDLGSEAEDIDFERDVKPALGPEVVVAVLEFAQDSDEDPPVVVLTQPDDEEAFRALLARSDEPLATQEVDGWHAVAENQAVLDRFLTARNGPRLSDSGTFERAMEDLDGDALVRGFVDGEVLAASSSEDELSLPPLDILTSSVALLGVGFAAAAEDGGGQLDGTAVLAEGSESSLFATDPFEAELPASVPADVLAYAGFGDLDGVISGFRDALAESSPGTEQQLGQLEALLGVSLEEDVAPLFAGEGAVYVRGGALIPEVTLVTRVDDEEQAVGTLDSIVEGIGVVYPVGTPQRSDVAGADVREVPISPPVSLFYAAFDGLLVITSSRDGIVGLRGDGDRLADDEDFRDALDRAGVPDETTGFGYVDLAAALPLIYGYAEVGLEATPESRQYTDPLRSLVFFGTEGDDVARFSLFLGVE